MQQSHLTPIALNSLTKWSGKTSLANGGRFLRKMSNETGSVKEIQYAGYLQQARIYVRQSSDFSGVKYNIVHTASERRVWLRLMGTAVSHSNCQFKQITKIIATAG